MERAGKKTRDIQFFSEKNGGMVCLHSPTARDYAKYLEKLIIQAPGQFSTHQHL